MARAENTTKNMGEEMQHIIEHAHALVEATSGELDERIKEARDALKERLGATKSGFSEIVRIPRNPDSDSSRNRTLIPRESGHPVQ